VAQTREARHFIQQQAAARRPFLLFLAWGAPHNPYHTAPAEYRAMYSPDRIRLRPNVPADRQERAREDLAGYYAHCTALDDCVHEVWTTLKQAGVEENTILVFTSDHGDMLHSQGLIRKQKPWDESCRVPLLIHYPKKLGRTGRELPALINTEDLMPTLLGLCGLAAPSTVQGLDYSGYAAGGKDPSDGAAIITCPAPFGEWSRNNGGREYRALRTIRYTYARDLKGPWLLYDNQNDPYQRRNLCGKPEHAGLQGRLDRQLVQKLADQHDEFLSGDQYIERWNYQVDATGTIPVRP
jgi:arylsulfatase A-like enzyme